VEGAARVDLCRLSPGRKVSVQKIVSEKREVESCPGGHGEGKKGQFDCAEEINAIKRSKVVLHTEVVSGEHSLVLAGLRSGPTVGTSKGRREGTDSNRRWDGRDGGIGPQRGVCKNGVPRGERGEKRERLEER